MDKISKQLYKKVKKMDLGNPVITVSSWVSSFLYWFENVLWWDEVDG